MGTHSIAEAKDRLSNLIEQALKGESIIITKHGRPVAELRPIPEPPRQVTVADLDWLRARRVKRNKTATIDAGTLVSQMRDEEWR